MASTGSLPAQVTYGNALFDGRPHAGWFVGHFVDQGKLQHSQDVEVKFSMNPTGKTKAVTSLNQASRSMAVLISGKHRLEFLNSTVLLEHPGDYVMWGAGVAHSWTSVLDSTVLTIRWPSLSGDQVASDVHDKSAPIEPGPFVAGAIAHPELALGLQ